MTQFAKRLTIGLMSLAMLGSLAVVSSHAVRAVTDEEEFAPIVNVPEDGGVEEDFAPIVNVPEVPAPEEDFAPIINVPEIEIPRPEVEIPRFGAILVIKFHDVDGDGFEDTGEPRMGGVLFHLNEFGFDHRIGVTDTNGEIFWLNTAIGSHIVREEVPAGFTPTTSTTQTVTVFGESTTVVKFGNRPIVVPPQPGAIKVIKFKDLNGNGLEDSGEPRMSGVLFHLDRNTGNVRVATTDANGEILWTNVTIGSHEVHEEVPAGFTVTTPNPAIISLSAGETRTLLFGNRPVVVPQVARILIVKFKDIDGDGQRDLDEALMGDVRFTLSGGASAEGRTDANGHLEFRDLAAGTYTVTEDVPAGFMITTPNPATITLVAGEARTLIFGNRPIVIPQQKARLEILKIRDADKNGNCEKGEPGQSGVTFTVVKGGVSASAATNAAGLVEFSLEPGTYLVTEQVPSGFTVIGESSQTITLNAGDDQALAFCNKEIEKPVAKPVELPPTGAMQVIIPGAAGVIGSLYAMVRRQRRYMVELLRNL